MNSLHDSNKMRGGTEEDLMPSLMLAPLGTERLNNNLNLPGLLF